jgi:C1A family cysteine protease
MSFFWNTPNKPSPSPSTPISPQPVTPTPVTPTKRKYNLIIERVPHEKLAPLTFQKALFLPPLIDLRHRFPAPFNQGELGSCTANALCGIVSYDLSGAFIGSRLFVYYNERVLENDVGDDAGALLSDGIITLQKYGVCPESSWEYNTSNFTVKPPNTCYAEAEHHKAIKVAHITNDVASMKLSLANRNPFVVGIQIYESFETEEVAKTGIVPFPDVTKEDCLGGHAVVCCGYNDKQKVWIMRNSWGVEWGEGGYFYLPYLYLLDSSLSTDMWSIQKIQ